MLEGLATWVLNTYLGQYLENLNTDQLSIGLLKGEVELENVPLRKDALRHLDMALEIRAGFVGKVRLQIPVARLRSEPWIIAFEQLYLVAGPINLNEYDEEAEENASFNRKMTQLDSIEATWRSKHESITSDTSYGSSYSSWLSYGTSFITNIIENIQLKILDVHIRYEDDLSKPGERFACGLTIESLTMQSSDQHWVPKFIYAGDKSMSYKLLELKNFGIYWDTSATLLSEKSIGELATLMVSSINGGDHDYIVEPVSASACLKRNRNANPLRSRSTPRFTCDLKLENFPFFLSDFQYNQIISSLRFYDRLERARPYRKWRPRSKDVKGQAREWWRYAIQCHLDKIHQRYVGRCWDFAFERAKDIRKYVTIYCEHLKSPVKVSLEMQQIKSKVEQELSFEELRVLRELCMERVAKELGTFKTQNKETESAQPVEPTTSPTPGTPTHPAGAAGEGILQSWFPAWGGWYSTHDSVAAEEVVEEGRLSNSESERHSDIDEVALQLEEEILYVISDSVENNTYMKRDAVFAQLSFSLKKGNITLLRMKEPVAQQRDPQNQRPKENCFPLFELEFSNVKVSFESRPRNQALSFDVELGTVSLKDQFTEGTSFPLLISQQRDSITLLKGNRQGSLTPSLTTSAMYARLSSMISSVSRLSSAPQVVTQPATQPVTQGPLFSLSYEKKPSKSSRIDHRLIITSQALDVVYNQRASVAITEFFYPPSLRQDEDSQLIRAWTASARERYEELKQQTREELKKNWDSVIQGLMTIERKKWDIQLDISAPQIIFPENLEDQNTNLVIFDFGKLVFCSSQQKEDVKEGTGDKQSTSDDEDAFETPCSTPEEFRQKEEPTRNTLERQSSVTETSFHEHLYDKFDLKLCDMQVLVAKVKDNWRFACQKGTGPMHVIDRFNINLHLERRVLEILPDTSTSGDPQWPHLMLSGSLPQLVVHVNEQKVHAIRTICSQYLFITTREPAPPPPPPSQAADARKVASDCGARIEDEGIRGSVPSISQPRRSFLQKDLYEDSLDESSAEARLIVMQFNVDKLSIELQSRRRSVAELQVTGVRAQVSRRPSDITASLSVHSLLLVDALQTFGSDFELLVASHKHISMDSVSGSLLDSEPCSPTSPASPDASMPGKPTSPVALSLALNSLASNRATSPVSERFSIRSPSGVVSPSLGHHTSSLEVGRDSEALINIEVTYLGDVPVGPDSQEESSRESAGSYLFCSVQFNALDVIANQETVVELVGFIHQLFTPPSKPPYRGDTPPHSHPSSEAPKGSSPPVTDHSKPSFYGSIAGLYSPPPDAPTVTAAPRSLRAEVNFDFHKLTILLLRAALKEKEVVGRKVGTAVLSHAKIEASVANDMLTWEGSLGGFQIRDVTPEGNKHQCIVSVGHDPIVESSRDLVSQLHSGVYQSHVDSRQDFAQRAFSFKVVRPLVLLSTFEEAHQDPASRDENSKSEDDTGKCGNKIYVQLHLASVCYTHSPQFLEELKSCAHEFKQYMTHVASSIKQAATEVAIGLVSKRIESFSTLSGGARDASLRHLSHLRHQNISRSTDTLNFPQPPPGSTLDSAVLSPTHAVAPDLSFNAELDVVLETPIVVFPESPNSANVLVAHLGQISIRNKEPASAHRDDQVMDLYSVRTAVFEISVKDMSLFALNVDERLRSRDIIFHPLSATMMNAEELYSCREHGTPILHSTSLELTLAQRRDATLLTDYEAGLVFPSDIYLDVHSMASADSFTIEGGFIAPLKVSVSRHQYQLICQAVNNLSMASVKKSEINLESRKMSMDPSAEKEKTLPGGSTSFPSQFGHITPERHVPIKCLFTIPTLCVELRGDVCQREEPMVNLVLKEISAVYDACELFKSSTQITLRSLVMEDLQLSDSQSRQHILMKSEDIEPKQQHTSRSSPTTSAAGCSSPRDIPKGAMASAPYNTHFISSSCPEMWAGDHAEVASASLPSKLEMEKPFYKALRKPSDARRRSGVDAYILAEDESKDDDSCPCTPPPSPDHGVKDARTYLMNKDANLVNINVYTVDHRSKDFFSKYDGNGRFVDVTLNSLVTVVNLESWVMVLDFFRSPSQNEGKGPQAKESRGVETPSGEWKPIEEANMVLEIHVKSLTLLLNRAEGELAKASVNQVWVRSVGSAGDLTLNGRLGSLSLIDCTPYGNHYKEKFLTVGSEAMVFQLFRYSTEDVSLLRKCDVRLKLKMSSIMYVHSHRFLQELTQFFLQFLFLRDKLSDWRALSAGLKVSERPHGTRVSLDISAGSPVIFIPMWSHSDEVLAVDLGSFSVSNKFLWSGSPETISKVRRPDLFDRLASSSDGYFRSRSGSGSLRSRSRSGSKRISEGSRTSSGEDSGSGRGQNCLLDVMQVTLANMDLFRSQRERSLKKAKKGVREGCDDTVWHFGSFTVVRKGSSLLRDKCALKLQVERNLDGETNRIVPDFSVHAVLTKVHATIDINTYELIRGLLAHNLGEPVSEMKLQPVFISLQQAAKPHRKVPFPASHIWTTLNIHFDLDDVIVEAELPNGEMGGDGVNFPPLFNASPRNSPFARINFIKSKLLYESFSDSSKDVDLVSQEIVISDTRFQNFPANKRSNVFSNILTPAKDKNLKNENPLQAEIHYRSTRDVTRFTVLLNNMRLMAIMDWWRTAQTFIQSAPPDPPGRAGSSHPVAKATLDSIFVEDASPKTNPLRLNPMVESTGLMTKHTLISEGYQVPFELKINITDSEVVIVENSNELDTSAVILKTTAVVSYRPHFHERPISCNLNQCELYSCTLGLEEETALSIIDPVTVNIEVNDRATKNAAVDIANITLQSQHTVEISLHQLNIRLSYHDMKMFQRILESIPRQKEEATSRRTSKARANSRTGTIECAEGEPANFTAQVEKLSVLGFSHADCLKGLKACGGRLDEAALWLTQNAQPQPNQVQQSQFPPEQINDITLRGLELKTGSINVTIIDDCGDCDVPLLEVCFLHLGLKQDYEWKGSACCSLSVDYYNRALSGWEPFIEPWKCRVEWQKTTHSDNFNYKFHLSLSAQDTVNVSITNTLLDLYYLVRDNWTDDYYNRERLDLEEGKLTLEKDLKGSPLRGQRRRTPFVPFALQNDTGCDLLFYPLTDSGRSSGSSEAILGEVSEENWSKVQTGKTVSFAFEGKAGKQRHGNSHAIKSHRLIVKVGNWNPVGPVTVDKVGVFFRLGLYQAGVQSSHMPSVRIVFDISMDGLARKLIRVRSALMLTNALPHAVELKLENISVRLGALPSDTLRVRSMETVAFPLPSLFSDVRARPTALGKNVLFSYSHVHVFSCHVENESQVGGLGRCHALNRNNTMPYRFYAYVRRDNYPGETVTLRASSRLDYPQETLALPRTQEWVQPGHTIILVSPLTITNLLPSDLHYSVKTTGDEGRVKTGQDAFLSSVDPEEEVDISFWTDLFIISGNVSIRPGSSPYVTSLKLSDSSGRPVYLQVKINQKYGKALRVTVSAFFWLINKTGLPIVFKQEGANVESAGQDSEHEVARCAAPLLFSFSDLEASPMLIARVGRNLHINAVPHVDPELQKMWLRAIPGCWLPFHWPRLDKDPLLCVCLRNVTGCFWSGGFLVDKTNSFNINIRDSRGNSHFLRVEVLMSEATYFVVFTEPHSLPPPFRVDNFSLVPITYFQTGTHEEYLRSVVRPRYCVPYAWDEVTLPPHITCIAPGGTSATYNLNVLGEGARLTYENFIYIAFTGTFKEGISGYYDDASEGDPLVSSGLDCLQLVLDVTEGSRVRLGRKEMGRRSQLWRMTSTGMLQHEGSSPPFDPASRKPRSNTNILVLDIAGPAPLPNEYTPLMLRKPDDRRRLTQTWRFTEDGRLCCQHPNMFVQAKDGFLGLASGNDVVLGPPQMIHYGTMPNGVPVEQAVGRQRLRPGSGILAIKVVMDGPTRVLQITDVQNKNSPQVARTETGDLVYIKDSGLTVLSSLSTQGGDKGRVSHRPTRNEPAVEEMQVQVVLEGGIGVSIVSFPEELAYTLFSDIVLEYLSSSGHRTFDCSVRDIQVDNQLSKAQCPVVLFISPQNKNDQSRHLPALQITSHQLKSPSLNAYIFKHLMVTIKSLSLTIEEALLCKCLVLLGHDKIQATLEKVEESEYETQRMLAAATSANATRYYFTHLKLVLNQVRLSVLTSKSMTPDLRNIRRKLGLTLVQFENALVNLDPFVRCHPFETSRFLLDSIKLHYESELRSQAMRILGSTDFLGNPFGLLADVSEGVQELVRDGSVGGLVMNVTHGMANSTAKVTGTLSNAVGRVTMDTQHEETRQRLLTKHLGQSPDHFVAGLMGFGLGLYGGLTSIVAQTYTGASKEGLPGFFSGFAKGMVGTVTKPAIGLLDLAAGTASAVRETSKNPAHKLPTKIRKPRLVVGMNGMMPRFTEIEAAGQELMRLFDESCTQIFLGYEVLKEGDDDLRILISSEQVLVFSWSDRGETPTVVLRVGFRDLHSCHPITLRWEVGSEEPRFYIEITMTDIPAAPITTSAAYPPPLPTKRPKVRCDSYAIAAKISDDINFAKTLYEELTHTLTPAENDDEENQESF